VLGRHGGTVVHAVVASARAEKPTQDFLALTVDYRDRAYAHGRVPLNASRRERHGSDEEILAARAIDRAVRPLFPRGYVDEVQITVTAHAVDGDAVVTAVNTASCALSLSSQPWFGPIGCVRVGLLDGHLKINLTAEERKISTLDLLYAGTKQRPIMIEAVAHEVPEDIFKNALNLAQKSVQEIIAAQESLKSAAEQKQKTERSRNSGFAAVPDRDTAGYITNYSELTNVQRSMCKMIYSVPADMSKALRDAFLVEAMAVYRSGSSSKTERSQKEGKLRGAIVAFARENFPDVHAVVLSMAVEDVMAEGIRSVYLESCGSWRLDGRGQDEVRPLESFADLLPRVHGSAFFKRGDTHVLCTTTLGSLRADAKMRSQLNKASDDEETPDAFMLHYDFPPYSTGSTGNATGPNRRMLGHGNLAERALRPVMPSIDAFPYTVRVFAECTSSNGSSSMASVCAGTMALRDAGVPLKANAAGISIGLITAPDICDSPLLSLSSVQSDLIENKDYVLLTDILGTEDHYGDMDFKIAGTEKGITAGISNSGSIEFVSINLTQNCSLTTVVQLDVKLPLGIPMTIIERAIDKARNGRNQVLLEICFFFVPLLPFISYR
jgi:polyribonucleotide nucleotidyltransferase